MSKKQAAVMEDGTPKRTLLHKLFGSTPGDGELQPKEGLSYSICGFGQNLICTIVGSYLTVFMTDAIGFSAIAVALLMLFARIYDAANDPIMGSIVDRTRTKWGKCRPYMKWMAIPIMIMTILCFLPWYPKSPGGFAAVTIVYLIWGMVYTVADVPYWGLSTAMSNDTYRRGNLLTIARLLCTLGAGIVTIVVPMITSNMTAATMNVTNASQTVINSMEGLFRNAYAIAPEVNLNDWFAQVARGEIAGLDPTKFAGVTTWRDYLAGVENGWAGIGSVQEWYSSILPTVTAKVTDATALKELTDAFQSACNALFELGAANPIKELPNLVVTTGAEKVLGTFTGAELYAAIDVSKLGTMHDLKYIYFVAAIVCCVIALPLFYLGFKNTVERNQTLETPPSLGHNLKLLFKNKPLMLIVLSGIGGAARMLFTYTGGLYFAKYVMGPQTGFWIIKPHGDFGGIGFFGEALYTVFTVAVVPGGLIASLLVPYFTKKFGKRNTYIWSHIIGGVAMLIAFIVGIATDKGDYTSPATIAVLIIALVIGGIPQGFGNIITYAMIGDTVEYLELKTGERAEGICFAMQTLINKIGMAVGAFVGVLAYYLADVEAGNVAAVTKESKDTMWTILMLVAAISFFLTVIPLFFYKFNEKEQQEAVEEIKKRKAALALENGEAVLDAADAQGIVIDAAEEGYAPNMPFAGGSVGTVPIFEQDEEKLEEEIISEDLPELSKLLDEDEASQPENKPIDDAVDAESPAESAKDEADDEGEN